MFVKLCSRLYTFLEFNFGNKILVSIYFLLIVDGGNGDRMFDVTEEEKDHAICMDWNVDVRI